MFICGFKSVELLIILYFNVPKISNMALSYFPTTLTPHSHHTGTILPTPPPIEYQLPLLVWPKKDNTPTHGTGILSETNCSGVRGSYDGVGQIY